jgi:hypothetical protein
MRSPIAGALVSLFLLAGSSVLAAERDPAIIAERNRLIQERAKNEAAERAQRKAARLQPARQQSARPQAFQPQQAPQARAVMNPLLQAGVVPFVIAPAGGNAGQFVPGFPFPSFGGRRGPSTPPTEGFPFCGNCPPLNPDLR